jgi:hypothetical protein
MNIICVPDVAVSGTCLVLAVSIRVVHDINGIEGLLIGLELSTSTCLFTVTSCEIPHTNEGKS